MFRKNQKGALDPFLIIALIVVLGVGSFLVYRIRTADESLPLESAISSKSKDKTVASSDCTVPDGWETYEDSEYGYSYSYPAGFSVNTITSEIDSTGDFGTTVTNADGAVVFRIEPLVWTDGSLYGSDSTTAINEGFDAGGIKQVAAISQELNASDDNVNLDDDSTGELKSFAVCGDEGWGFDVTGDFTTGFTSVEEGGTLVDEDTTVVYVAGAGEVYRVRYSTGSPDAASVLTTLAP